MLQGNVKHSQMTAHQRSRDRKPNNPKMPATVAPNGTDTSTEAGYGTGTLPY